MAYDQIKESIKAVIKENGNYEITGNVLQVVLLSMVDTLGPEYQFLGIATKSTVPVVLEGNSFYITTEVGTYTNFKNSGNTTITVNKLGILTSTNGTAWNFTPIFIGVSKGGGEVFNDYDNNTAVGVNSHAEGQETESVGVNSHAEGFQTHANKDNSHAEGRITVADGVASHAEGNKTVASGSNSHTEGYKTKATESNSHAEGNQSGALGLNSHAEGLLTNARGINSHAEGIRTEAVGNNSHAEGQDTTAGAANAHAEGQGTVTEEVGGHVAGMYNAVVANGLFNFGIGSSDDKRKSAMIITNEGKVYFTDAGGYDGGTSIANAKSIQDILRIVEA